MKKTDISKLRKAMEKELDAKRFEHTLGVAYTAASLAMVYDVDLSKAIVAGLLHDCAKCLSDEKRISICEKKKIEITKVEYEKPSLLHAKVGMYLAKKDYDIDDEDILNAILYHTTGRPGMSILEKIIYIADYIEPGRKPLPKMAEIRKAAFQNIDEALVLSMEGTLSYLKETNEIIDPVTQATYDYYKKELK